MSSSRANPVIVGVGQLRSNRDKTVEQARQPLDLMVDAAERAANDAGSGASILAAVDHIAVVPPFSWHYYDLPGLIARRIGARPLGTSVTPFFGTSPADALENVSAAVSRGEIQVALLCGCEAAASISAFRKAGIEPPWPEGEAQVSFPSFSDRMMQSGLVLPIRAYPLFENALRARRGESFAQSQQWSGDIYSKFTRAAARNDAAWDPEPRTAEEIISVTPENRMICFPYPLSLNANPTVDQAAAVLVMSEEAAGRLSVPRDQWVYVWGGAGAVDSEDVLERSSFYRSPALEVVLKATLQQAEIEAKDFDVIDIYSCFPIVPKLAALELGLSPDAELSETGGHTAFGGPAANYTTHAAVAVARKLRTSAAKIGLIHGNGGHLTKQHAVLLGAEPHPKGYVGREDRLTQTPSFVPPLEDAPVGEAEIETYTVDFDRDGNPTAGCVVGLLRGSGARFFADVTDRAAIAALIDEEREPIGRVGTVSPAASGRNEFVLTD